MSENDGLSVRLHASKRRFRFVSIFEQMHRVVDDGTRYEMCETTCLYRDSLCDIMPDLS